MTYTNPNYDMFERDRIKAYWLRAKEQKEKEQEQEQIKGSWSPRKRTIMI